MKTGDNVAIATFERDPARDAGTPDLRFRLLQEICHLPEARFWRALDRRSGKTCVVRVIDADREQSSRRLGDLHRERTLAERIGHPSVLRADVPTIEGDRIFQVVEPEPARSLDCEAEGGRLAILNLLVAAAGVLADAHSRGVSHGAFSRASCLRTSEGRLLVQGFMGDAAGAAAIRDGAAADHRAFLEFATEMLRNTGGAPPRLRRYFNQHLVDGAPLPAPGAMAELCVDLRESLEDTFPWPLAIAPGAEAAVAADVASAPRSSAPECPTVALPRPDLQLEIASWELAVSDRPAVAVGRSGRPATSANVSAIIPAPIRVVAQVPPLPRTPAAAAEPAARHQADAASPASSLLSSASPERSLRPWLAAVVVIALAAAALQFGSKRDRAASSPVAVPTGATVAPAAAAPATVAAPGAAAASRPVEASAPRRQDSVSPANRANERAATVATPLTTPRSDVVNAAPSIDPSAPSAQAIRSRVATLVAGGNRALTALEPGAAAEAFAAALVLSPEDRAALEGSQRARRLQGVAALMRDARESSARGDHARAVQGYAQSLSNDPRNRGLADALATARRNLGRDAIGALLAEGHAALGSGKFEAARAAFEKALQADPAAPGARRAAEQASTAILLRDAAASRRDELARSGG